MTQQNNNAEQYATVRLQSGGSFSRGEQEEEEEEEASGREWQPLGQAPMDKKLTQWLIAALCCGLFVYLLYGTVWPSFTSSNECLQPQKLMYGMDAIRERYGWVCCGPTSFAEPSGTAFAGNGPESFTAIASQSTVTFYDAACGIPLFRAPVGRSMEAFLAESRAHGWPSFRPAEAVSGNVMIHSGGEMESACGTHFGHDLPDSRGSRYCIDLICIAGHGRVEAANATAGGPGL